MDYEFLRQLGYSSIELGDMEFFEAKIRDLSVNDYYLFLDYLGDIHYVNGLKREGLHDLVSQISDLEGAGDSWLKQLIETAIILTESSYKVDQLHKKVLESGQKYLDLIKEENS